MKTPFPRLASLARFACIATLASACILPAYADRGDFRGRPGDRPAARHFDHREWRGGRWVHGDHGGHLGWWWVVSGAWYFYPRPIYPYPPVVIQQRVPEPAIVQPAPQASPPVWYYCPGSDAYYPYVQRCPEGWRTVPAVPPGLREE
ncbi:hypothetical protein [Thauera sinica]|uniref:Lipoprotein n=1 Tax=Thauera sinica TaxID=2665146 RepID=A0ABW1ANK5_9RHOO|nr:hypothetical protein [Thauera sp. K11]